MVLLPFILFFLSENRYTPDRFYFKQSTQSSGRIALFVGIFIVSLFILYKVMKYNKFIYLFGSRSFCKALFSVFFIQIIHVAIPEEYLFRVFLLGNLLNYGEPIAVILSSVFFAFGHMFIMEERFNLKEKIFKIMLFHFPLGILFGVLWLRCNSFILNVCLHSLCNASLLSLPLMRRYFV